MKSNEDMKARAAALFRELVDQDHRDALAEERVRVERERANMAKLRALRLAAETKAANNAKAKRKPGRAAKR
jgi:hypothetical protein